MAEMHENEFRGVDRLDDGDGALPRRERLLNRVVDGEASDAEWAEFRALADAEFVGAERSTWRDLAQAQRQQAVITVAVGGQVGAAERVTLPRVRAGHDSPVVLGRVGAWTGWATAAAAAVLIGANAWFGGLVRLNEPGMTPPPVSTAGLFRIDSPEDAIQVYKDKGEQSGLVIGEMPDRVLVESRPRPDGGGFEVVYIRQFIERAEVTDLYRFGHSEAGGPVLIPVSAPVRHAESF